MPCYLPPSSVLVALFAITSAQAFVPANKISPAEPPASTITAQAPSTFVLLKKASVTTARGSGPATTTALLAKKKKKVAAAASSKIQVKMLKHVEGTGHLGEVVMVTPAFFNNKLRPSGAAEKISDEAVAAEQKEKDEKRRQVLEAAKDAQSKVTDMEISLTMKAGPEGHLFGSVGHKTILKELQSKFPKGALGKKVKISSIKDEEGNEISGDVKDLGTYTARIELLKDVEAKFTVTISKA
mmetsp:Transcript_33035/g.97467  ORF Transcript_33035/g.97467 Transcript_33035/m.97467 type:complete len:241 (+) Transcript_33035:40-762(+)